MDNKLASFDAKAFLERYPHLHAQFPQINSFGWRVSDSLLLQTQKAFTAVNRAIEAAVKNFSQDKRLREILSLSDQAGTLLSQLSDVPYHVGCIRPDFVFSTDEKIVLTEINARFPLNGFLISFALSQTTSHFISLLRERIGSSCVVIVKGREKGCDIHGLRDLFPDLKIVSPKDYVFSREDFVFLELHQDEICECVDRAELLKLHRSGRYLNDLRTVLIGHDKKLFAAMSSGALDEYLSEDEIKVIRQVIPETKVLTAACHIDSKDHWVLKPGGSGKGDGVVVGASVSAETWLDKIHQTPSGSILQQYISQQRYEVPTSNGTKEFYIAGIIPGFDGRCFGPGIFRGSEDKVVNVFNGGTILPPLYEVSG